MIIRKFWSPGIAAFVLVVVEIVLARLLQSSDGLQLLDVFILSTSPIVSILGVGAFLKYVRGMSKRSVDLPERPVLLCVGDMLLGLAGISFVALYYLGINLGAASVHHRIILLLLLLIFSSAGYVLLSDWSTHRSAKKIAYTAMVLVAISVPQLGLFSIVSTAVDFFPQKGAMAEELNNLSAQAYQYRIRPLSMSGGEGSYVGFVVPAGIASTYYARYTSNLVSPDTIEFFAISLDGKYAVSVRLDAQGKTHDWRFREPDPTFEERCSALLTAVLRFLKTSSVT